MQSPQRFSRDELLAIWSQKYRIDHLKDSPLANVSSSDYKYGALVCPICLDGTPELVRVNEQWACPNCNKVRIGKGNGKAASIYRITNDLIEFLGVEITMEQLANPSLINAYVTFARLRQRPGDYLLFLELLYKIVETEHKGLHLMSFIERSRRLIEEPLPVLERV